ncbi:MAG: thiamine phosphate synthase [Tistrella sp.]|uniref:Thiamine-phosphate synthase n=1 Tax=Tistrella mobilis TaxID=171437 RepID=A0A161Q1D6_9PROT|nr:MULTISPECIES: thiamine phosphate synthase [Tistrella]KYO51214.1 thiamine-phosphate synthase [Tistrella mobilis]MAD40574.1 thiamine phosphate synthase [Tistrella sp.]MAM74229.1 thiamine phosphate synthase [Tistrella sp.]MBA78952.1 thiamine phosphate synthase [Tistrella sp.]HAE49390.1 thiamine phosphate synthase [Tistrella mobilis]
MSASRDCRLYLLTPPAFVPAAFADTLARALDGGDVACLQIRLKDAADDDVRRAVERLLPVAQPRGVAVLVNDRPDIAAEMGADGAHIGQDDMDQAKARKILGPNAILGVSAYASRHRAMVAAEEGADYVAFGAFFPSTTKTPPATAGLDLLDWWQELMEVPCVAIGGITVANCAALVRAGADFLAVTAGVWNYEAGPAQAVADFNREIARALEDEGPVPDRG